jgi:ABC-2 type transport system ATP-binding protein
VSGPSGPGTLRVPRERSGAPASGRGTPGETPLLEVDRITVRFGAVQALTQVSLDVRRGEVLAIIGPNGAGKTTLLTILAGIRDADAGSFSVPGEVGWVPQGAALYHRLTVTENLRLFARLERVGDVENAVERMLGQTGLADRRDDPVATLSGGNQQRVNIAIGLLSEPGVLLLDEPSTGLDPRQRARLWEFVLDLAGGGTTVIYSTHHLHEAERYGSRLLVLADGERVFDGTSAELHAAVGGGDRDFESAFVAFLHARGH